MQTAVRDAKGRFLTAASRTFSSHSRLGLTRAEQAPFAAAVVIFAVILGVLTLIAVVGSVLAAILPQVGTGLGIGALLGLLIVARRKPVAPSASRSTAIVVGSADRDITTR